MTDIIIGVLIALSLSIGALLHSRREKRDALERQYGVEGLVDLALAIDIGVGSASRDKPLPSSFLDPLLTFLERNQTLRKESKHRMNPALVGDLRTAIEFWKLLVADDRGSWHQQHDQARTILLMALRNE